MTITPSTFVRLIQVILIVHSPYFVQAQVVNISPSTMTPTFGAGHSYIQNLVETVNPANGALSVRIQIPTPRGRGITLPFYLRYDSTGSGELLQGPYIPDPTQGNIPSPEWTPKDVLGISKTGGWSYGLPSVNFTAYTTWCPPPNSGFYYQGTDNYIFLDSQGQQHPLRVASVIPSAGCVPPVVYSANGDGHVYATLGAPPQRSIVGPLKVVDPDGTTYEFSQLGISANGTMVGTMNTSSQTSYIDFPDTIEDRNGNMITSTSDGSEYQYKDTLGRTLVSFPTQAPTSGTSTLAVGNLNYALGWTTTGGLYNSQPAQDYGSLGPSAYTTAGYIGAIYCATLPELESGGTVISSIALSNGDTYQFHYTNGLMSEIDYPSGEWVKYDWKLTNDSSDVIAFDGLEDFPTGGDYGEQSIQDVYDDGNPTSSGPSNAGWRYYQDACVYKYHSLAVGTRTVGYGDTTTQIQTFAYSTTWDTNNNILWTTKSTTVQTTDVLRNRTSKTVYTYTPTNSYTVSGVQTPAAFRGQAYYLVAGISPSQVPVESTIQYFDWGTPTVPLKAITETWDPEGDLLTEATSLDGGPASSVKNTWNSEGYFLLKTQVDEYDYGQADKYQSAQTTYQAVAEPLGGTYYVPCKEQTYNGSGTQLAETDLYYDGGTTLCAQSGGQPVEPVANLVLGTHDEGNFGGTLSSPRGNVTQAVNLIANGNSPTDTYSYDETGQVTSHTSACGNTTCPGMAAAVWTTTYRYTDSAFSDGSASGNTNAYIQSITRPALNGVSHVTAFSYRLSDGQVSEITDENSQVTSFYYNDPLNRLTDVYGPTLAGGRPHANRKYTDGLNPSWQDTDPIGNVIKTQLDGFGRVSQIENIGTGVLTDTSYDGIGKVWTESSPYLTKADSTYGLTHFDYDALGRPTYTTYADSSTRANQYFQNTVTMTDENKNIWKQTFDSFGRLSSVNEPDGASTTYQYTVLGDLSSVTQPGLTGEAGRTRSFAYDALRQLVTSDNVETGNVCYGLWTTDSAGKPECGGGYDAAGNLLYKTAANGTVVAYQYDALNRLIRKTFPVPGATSTYMSTCYQYDTILGAPASANLIGHLAAEWTQNGNTCASSYTPSVALTAKVFLTYDAMGRPLLSQQCVKAMCTTQPFTQNQTYDLAGNMTSWQDGRGLMTFGQNFDSAGRPISLTNSYHGNNLPSVLLSVQGYTAAGALQNWNVGNFLNFSRTYDNRLRITGESATH